MSRLPKRLSRITGVCAVVILVIAGLSWTSLQSAGSGAAAGARHGSTGGGAGADSGTSAAADGGSAGGSARSSGADGGGQVTGQVNGHKPTAGDKTAPRGTQPASGTQSGGTQSGGTQSTSGPVPVVAVPPGLWQVFPADLQTTVSNFTTDQGAAGVTVGIATPQGRFLSLNGFSDVESATELRATDVSAYRSITKSFVGTVILQLAAEGKLRLDDPVSDYVASVPSGDTISVRMALEMRTGLTEYSDTQEFSDQMNSWDGYVWTDADLLADSFAQPLDFDPGTDFGYSNTNTVLLGAIIHRVTGQSWDQEVTSRLLEPLHLTSIVYPPDAALGRVLEPPEKSSQDGTDAVRSPSDTLYSAAGGLFGDIGDLLSWGTALGSGTLLPADLQAARMTAVSDPENGDFTPAYDGYGLALGELNGWWGHTGVGLGYESLVMYDPVSKTTVAVLIDTALADPDAAAALFRELVPQLGTL